MQFPFDGGQRGGDNGLVERRQEHAEHQPGDDDDSLAMGELAGRRFSPDSGSWHEQGTLQIISERSLIERRDRSPE